MLTQRFPIQILKKYIFFALSVYWRREGMNKCIWMCTQFPTNKSWRINGSTLLAWNFGGMNFFFGRGSVCLLLLCLKEHFCSQKHFQKYRIFFKKLPKTAWIFWNFWTTKIFLTQKQRKKVISVKSLHSEKFSAPSTFSPQKTSTAHTRQFHFRPFQSKIMFSFLFSFFCLSFRHPS